MSDQDRQLGIKVLGLGSDEDRLAASIWHYKKWHRITPVPTGEDLEEYTLEEMPQSVSDSVNPIERTLQTSAFSFTLPASEKVISSFFWQEATPFSTLSVDVAKDSGTVSLLLPGYDGRVIFIGAEAIKLGAHVPGIGYIGSIREFWESRSTFYPAGAGVYSGPPQKKGREVHMVVYDPATDKYEVRWRGVMERQATNSDSTELTIQCASGFDALGRVRVARNEGTLTSRSSLSLTRIGPEGLLYASGFIDMTGIVPGVKKTITTQFHYVALQIGQGLFLGKYTPGKDEIRVGNLKELAGGAAVLGSGQEMLESGGRIADVAAAGLEVREIYLISRELDELTGAPISATSALGASSTSRNNPYNRTGVLYALLTSSSSQGSSSFSTERFDVHTPVWSRDFSHLLAHDAWLAAIASAQDALPVEQLVLGWDGTSESVYEVADILIGPAGQFLASTEDNIWGIQSFAALDVRTFCRAQSQGVTLISPKNGGEFRFEDEFTQAVEEVEALVGGLPWEEPSRITVKLGAAGDYEGVEKPDVGDPRQMRLDLRTLSKRVLATRGDGDSGDLLSSQLRAQGALIYLSMPKLGITVPDARELGIDPYDLGTFISLQDGLPEDPRLPCPVPGARPKLITNPANEDTATQVRFAGMLVARDFGVQNLTFSLEMLLVSWNTALLARLRAPSMRIESAAVSGGYWELTGGSLYGSDVPDAQTFKVGDEIEIWEPWGARWTGNVLATIASISGDLIRVKEPAYGTNPASASWKRVVRLARSDTYANDAHVECFDRAFAYYANDADQIREPEGAVKGDPYG